LCHSCNLCRNRDPDEIKISSDDWHNECKMQKKNEKNINKGRWLCPPPHFFWN
jgi:hypothetical protein